MAGNDDKNSMTSREEYCPLPSTNVGAASFEPLALVIGACALPNARLTPPEGERFVTLATVPA